MSNLQTVQPKHSRSTSISSKKTTSHQRKPSLNVQHNSLSSTENTKRNSMTKVPTINTFSNKANNTTTSSMTNTSNTTSTATPVLAAISKSPRIFNTIISRINAFLTLPGPLLPHSKHANVAFGGVAKPSFLTIMFRSKIFRFIALFYTSFSIFLTLNHTYKYLFDRSQLSLSGISPLDSNHITLENWVPERTYDAAEPYSLLDEMTHGLKMHKMFDKSYYDAAKNIQPFWLKSSTTHAKDQVTIITTVTSETWPDLIALTSYWDGPISVLVHLLQDQEEERDLIIQDYYSKSELYTNVDVHLAWVPSATSRTLSVLFPRNAERNFARMYAQTDYVMALPAGVVPATELRRTLLSNKERIDSLLSAGDLLALPTFHFRQPEMVTSRDDMPYDKAQLVLAISEDRMVLDDKHWKENEGPTDLERWMNADSVYAVDKYEYHYEPVVIESKTVQPWCSERFLDNRAACLFSSYLQGNEIWVLPDDYVVQMPSFVESERNKVTDFDNVVENRIYAKFYWEQCVHHARQLSALGLWRSSRSQHIRSQCSRVIQNWGKGLIENPE